MFKVKGSLMEVLADQKIGNFLIRSFVIVTGGEKPKTIKFDLWNEKITLVEPNDVGSILEIGFDIESKLAKERYFTNLRAYSVTVAEVDKDTHTKKQINSNVGEEFDLPF